VSPATADAGLNPWRGAGSVRGHAVSSTATGVALTKTVAVGHGSASRVSATGWGAVGVRFLVVRLCSRREGNVEQGMDRFVSTITNKIDAKGRVSVPAAFRAVLDRDRYQGADGGGIYCYPSLDAPALDCGGERLARKIDGLLAGLPDYSDERDQLSVALYGEVQVLSIDGDGRIVIPEGLRAHAGLRGTGGSGGGAQQVTFVGLGDKFQMWDPEQFEARRALARAKVQEHRKLFAGGGGV